MIDTTSQRSSNIGKTTLIEIPPPSNIIILLPTHTTQPHAAMARVKRFSSACWRKDHKGKWKRTHVGKPSLVRPPGEASPIDWPHKNDTLEAIIGDDVDEHGNTVFLAKWKGFPISQASWENRYRFSVKEKQAYYKQKGDLQYVEDLMDRDASSVLDLHPRPRLFEFEYSTKETLDFNTVVYGPRGSTGGAANEDDSTPKPRRLEVQDCNEDLNIEVATDPHPGHIVRSPASTPADSVRKADNIDADSVYYRWTGDTNMAIAVKPEAVAQTRIPPSKANQSTEVCSSKCSDRLHKGPSSYGYTAEQHKQIAKSAGIDLSFYYPWYPLCDECVHFAGMGRGCTCLAGFRCTPCFESLLKRLSSHKALCNATGHDSSRCDGCRVHLPPSAFSYVRCNCCMGVRSA